MFDYQKYQNLVEDKARKYRSAEVFPHIVIDDFLDAEILAEAVADFPPLSGQGWIHYQHVNENKGGLNKKEAMPPKLSAIIDELNSPAFVSWLSKLTGIPGLKADLALEGGGLHQIKRGGFLNVHADFTVHPHHRMWRRRVNLLIYLNHNWKEEYGGRLELWTKDMSRSFEAILPIFNRCVVFNTDADSFHGHPHPLTCPDEITRKSIALYYFTEEETKPYKAATNYRGRPEDGAKAIFIWLDKQVLALYNIIKGAFGLNDDFASRLLKNLSRLFGRSP